LTRRAAFRLADVDRLIERVSAHGLTVEAVEITVDGAVRVLTSRPAPGVALNDDDDWVSLAGQTQDLGRA
jgi:hypothetical protein